MKAAIYNPYWDTLGGGERYTLGVVKAFVKRGYTVHIEWNDKNFLKSLERRFGTKLSGVRVVESINRGDGYDACFWVSDGSIPTLKSRNNILHFQVPFQKVNGKSLMNRMKLFRIKNIVCNSNFTKNIIDREFGIKSEVIYPPVSVNEFHSRRKQNIIVYVGRFSSLAQNKRHDVVIEIFKKFYKKNKNWKLILAGGVEIGDDITEKLEERSAGYPIEILKSPDHKTIKKIFGEAKMFWSASGYGVDENVNPEKVEHFGIVVVEAMAAKAIPLVVAKGGHKEIIVNGENGYLWSKKSELLSLAQHVADNFQSSRLVAKNSQKNAQVFSEESFFNKISGLIN